jgi:hypothetical protein
MNTMDLGLAALVSDSSGSASAVAVMGAMVVGVAAIGVMRNMWGETSQQEKARLAAEARWDAKHPPRPAPAPVHYGRPVEMPAPVPEVAPTAAGSFEKMFGGQSATACEWPEEAYETQYGPPPPAPRAKRARKPKAAGGAKRGKVHCADG